MTFSNAPEATEASAQRPVDWRWFAVLFGWFATWALLFKTSLASAASVWLINDTFKHCFLVLPGALYLIWCNRGAIAAESPSVSLFGVGLVTICLAIWSLGCAGNIDTLQHIATFALIPSAALMLLGFTIIKHIWFPLAFILFSVPFGEELIPLFQEITADIAIFLLRLIDVPVFKHGLYFSVPNGQFVVAEACSGVRFFIACVVLGFTYAHLNFLSTWRAAIFSIFSIILPIIANGVRAFGIIYIGYASDMKYAVGADHLIYGWIFFAFIVIFLLFCGYFFSDGQREFISKISAVSAHWQHAPHFKHVIFAAAPLLAIFVVNQSLSNESKQAFQLTPYALTATNEIAVNRYAWTPRVSKADKYEIADSWLDAVKVYRAVFYKNQNDREMISWDNRTYDIDAWSIKNEYKHSIESFANIRILDLTAANGSQRLLAYWYVTPQLVSSKETHIKLQQALNKLLHKPSGGALIAISLAYDGDTQTALDKLITVLNSRAAALSTPQIHAGG